MDTMQVTDGAEPRVTLTCESRLVDLERAEVRRYTDADQQAEYATVGLPILGRHSWLRVNLDEETSKRAGALGHLQFRRAQRQAEG